jgi:kynurenine formamidase
MTWIELSHVIRDGTVTYPGLPAPRVSDHLDRDAAESRYAPGVRFYIARLELVANTGTYIDAPFHRFDGAPDVAELPLERVADVPAVVVRPRRDDRSLDHAIFEGHEVEGRAVLVETGWARHFGTPAYGTGHPYLTRSAAEWLVEHSVALVGIDSLNVDDDQDTQRPVHTVLLGAGIPIVEHLCHLERLPTEGARFFARPLPIRGLGSCPVRALARLPGSPTAR